VVVNTNKSDMIVQGVMLGIELRAP